MSANTPAARDILGLSSPTFIQLPGYRIIIRVDDVVSVKIRENTVVVQLRSSEEPLRLLNDTPAGCTRAYNQLAKLLL